MAFDFCFAIDLSGARFECERVCDLRTGAGSAGDLNLAYEPSGTRGFADLRRAAQQVDLDGVPVLVAALADVIRSKEAANRPKDDAVLHVLRELLRRESHER